MSPPKLDDFPIVERRVDRQELTELFKQQRSDVREIIDSAVVSAVSAAIAANGCPLPLKNREQVTHLYGVLIDVGQGKLDEGIREFRANMVFISEMRRKAKWIGGTTIGAICVLVGAGIFNLIMLVMDWINALKTTPPPQ